MKPIERAKLLDKLLLKFEHTIIIHKEEINSEAFLKYIHSDKKVIDSLFKKLVSDRLICDVSHAEYYEIEKEGEIVIDDINIYGYYAKEKRKRNQCIFNWLIAVISILTLIATIIGLIISNINTNTLKNETKNTVTSQTIYKQTKVQTDSTNYRKE